MGRLHNREAATAMGMEEMLQQGEKAGNLPSVVLLAFFLSGELCLVHHFFPFSCHTFSTSLRPTLGQHHIFWFLYPCVS